MSIDQLTYDFDAQETLITSQDVIDCTPIDEHSTPKYESMFIINKEERLFNTCLGMEFYNELFAARVAYRLDGTGDEQYSSFQKGTPYALGAFVFHAGAIYEVIQATDGTQTPPMRYYFKIADKFNIAGEADKTAAFNFLWNRYLKWLIAWEIHYGSVATKLLRITTEVKSTNSNDSQRASGSSRVKELTFYRAQIGASVDQMTTNMHMYMLRNEEHFENYKPILDSKIAPAPRRHRRHFGLNTNNSRF